MATLKDVKRIVIKVGTSSLTHSTGKTNIRQMKRLVTVISDIVNSGIEVALVSSGAIGVGVGKLGLKERPVTTAGKQAAATVGQCELMHIYSKFFGEYSHIVGQVLLTRDVVEDDHIRENVVNTFETLLENKIIPIVNENDTVAIDEIENIVRFGDNDNLSAIVAELVSADLLIILSDIDGFYDSDPRKNPNSKLIKTVEEITPELEACAGGAGSNLGTGGMATKLTAAKRAISANCNMILANGENPSLLIDIVEGKEVGTLFMKKNK